MTQRTPYPEIDTTDGTGYEWLGRFMEAQASVMANAIFFGFKLGQIGVAQKYDQETARAMVADLKTDRADLAFADGQLLKVMDGILANIERNLASSENSPMAAE